MANTLNTPLCASEFGNTGRGDCLKEIKKIVGAIQTPSNFLITKDDLATLQTILVDKTHAAIGSRIFPYWDLVLTNDGTEDPTIQTDEYGGKKLTRYGDYDLSFRMKVSGPDLYGNIEKNSGAGKSFIFIDEEGTLLGKKRTGGFGPISIDEFIVPPAKFATGDATTLYILRFLFGSSQLRKGNLAYINVDFVVSDEVKGLEDVEVIIEDQEENVLKVVLKTKHGGINLSSAYGSVLAAPGAWIAKDKQTNDALDISTVSEDATLDNGNGGFTVTIDPTDYNPLDGGDKFSLNLAAPATLKGSPYNVVGFEGEEVVLTVPAS